MTWEMIGPRDESRRERWRTGKVTAVEDAIAGRASQAEGSPR